jgi:transposase
MDGIWYVLWTGCQWKAIDKRWFGASSSVLHARFQAWQRQGEFVHILSALIRYYGRRRHVRWSWQAADSRIQKKDLPAIRVTEKRIVVLESALKKWLNERTSS